MIKSLGCWQLRGSIGAPRSDFSSILFSHLKHEAKCSFLSWWIQLFRAMKLVHPTLETPSVPGSSSEGRENVSEVSWLSSFRFPFYR